ncbi:MAG: hypothetical protein ACRDZX_18065 [Acidimicrobiales bacterium]
MYWSSTNRGRKAATLTAAATAVAGLVAGGAPAAAASAAFRPAAAALPRLVINMNGDKSIAVAGTAPSGATELALHNAGNGLAEPAIVHLRPGVTPQAVSAYLKSPAAGDPNTVAEQIGTIVADAGAPPPGTTVIQVNLPAGNYVAVNTSQNGPSSKWPLAPFTVSPSAHPAALPKPDAVVREIDFAFQGPSTLRHGELVRFENQGYEVHMALALGIPKGVSAQHVVQLVEQGKDNQLPRSLSFAELQGPVAHDAAQQERLALRPGTYVLVCFMDTQDGREHTQLGMERVIHVL